MVIVYTYSMMISKEKEMKSSTTHTLVNKSGKKVILTGNDMSKVKVSSNPNGTWKVTVKGRIFSTFATYFEAIEWVKAQ